MKPAATRLPKLLAIPTAAALTLAVALAFAMALAAQEGNGDADATPETDEVFIESIDVNVVNVDVYVTDKQGNRITGLKRDDFDLFENGRPVVISNFYAVEGGRPTPESVPATAPSAEPPAVEREPHLDLRLVEQPVVPEDQRLHLIVYIDNLFIKPFNRNKVVRQVKRFLYEEITPGDRVMLVTFDRSLHVRHQFTSDMRAISDALTGLEKLSGFAVQADSDRKDVLRRMEDAGSVFEAEAFVDLYAKSLHYDVETTVRYLKEMVGSLAGLPGRKAVLHVSDGIPMTAAEDLFFMLDSRFGDKAAGITLRSSQYDNRRRFRELTASANANRVTFYTLEAVGLRSHASLSAEYGGSRGTDGVVVGSRAEADFIRVAGQQEPLMMMAHDTGGLATFNTNNISLAFEGMAADFRNYYSLGYVPSHSGDGRYHDIEVKVKRKGLTVRHRTGYRDKTAETYLSEGTLAALLYGIDSNPMGVELRFNQVRRDVEKSDRYLVPIEVRVPLSAATLVPQTDVYHGKLRFSVAVIDDNGRMSPVEQEQVPLTVPMDQIEAARTQYYVYAVELRMRRGSQRVAVGVRDELASESSYVRRPIQIGST